MKTRASKRPPARCLALLSQLSRYIDKEMSVRERRKIDTHCRDCARCRRVIAGLRRTIALCRSAGVPVPARVRKQARARITRLLRSRQC